MTYLVEARTILDSAEQSLRALAARAATAGEYDNVIVLADWARAIKGLTLDIDLAEAPQPAEHPNPETAHAQRTLKKPPKKRYPRFFRQTNSLVKVAWSKANRAEYEHKAPKAVVLDLVRAIARAGQKNRLIAMERVMPLKSPDGSEIPTYQSYLCLAWLRHTGLIRQHGRKGYSIKSAADFEGQVSQAWESLEQRV